MTSRIAVSLGAACCLAAFPLSIPAQSDTPWLYGIHWYADNTSDSDPEVMSGGKGMWIVDQCLLNSLATAHCYPANLHEWETPWVTLPTENKTQPYYKPGYFSGAIAKGHTYIVRLHPDWAVNTPYPGETYDNTAFAADCKVAAQLMSDVHIWQIGNEANLAGENLRFDASPSTQSYTLAWPANELDNIPELYAATYVACRDKIHEVTPSTTPATQIVLMQPNSPGRTDAGVNRFMDSNEFLARMIDAVPDKSKIDGFALHSYAQPGGSNFGADAFMSELKQQLMIIDQAGLGDRPVFITEFNKHMPNETETVIGANFCTTAFQMLHAWNTGASQVLPGQPNHDIQGAAWFVYRNNVWHDYSLRYKKDLITTPTATANPWYAFQAAAAQNYPRGGATGTNGFGSSASWWDDSFSGSSLDAAAPLPDWLAETGGGGNGQVAMTGSGAVRLVGSTGAYGNASIRTPDSYVFTDFQVYADITFVNAGGVANDEKNFDFRIREGDGFGYSLTFYSSQSNGSASARAGWVYLRRTNDWGVTYKSAQIPGGINTGDSFRIAVTADDDDLSFKVYRLGGAGSVVLDWTGANKAVNSDQRVGGVRMMVYNLNEVQVDKFAMGGLTAPLVPTAAEDWALFE